MNCDEFGWAIHMSNGDVEEYDNAIETGRSYVETNETFALEGKLLVLR